MCDTQSLQLLCSEGQKNPLVHFFHVASFPINILQHEKIKGSLIMSLVIKTWSILYCFPQSWHILPVSLQNCFLFTWQVSPELNSSLWHKHGSTCAHSFPSPSIPPIFCSELQFSWQPLSNAFLKHLFLCPKAVARRVRCPRCFCDVSSKDTALSCSGHSLLSSSALSDCFHPWWPLSIKRALPVNTLRQETH